jgi:tRNA (guanine-N7-)-methyltransferase
MTVRTYKPRRGRVTPRQRAAIEAGTGILIEPDEIGVCLAGWPGPVVLEIGFGTGTATALMAEADPTTLIVGIDVHTPGVGELLHRTMTQRLRNVAVIEADAIAVLREHVPTASLAGVRSYFPDPWPKARHHKRRLVTPEHAALIADRVVVGGTWDLATDWEEYAEQMRSVLDASDDWAGGPIPRPDSRPVTHFERRAIRDGRPIIDLHYERT